MEHKDNLVDYEIAVDEELYAKLEILAGRLSCTVEELCVAFLEKGVANDLKKKGQV